MRRYKHWKLLTLILFLSDTPVYATHALISRQQEILDQTASVLQEMVIRGQLEGISLGVVNKSGLIWFKNFGYANRDKMSQTGNQTLYRAGSLSKLFTASAILQLEQQGTIDIDQAVTAYIPRFYYKTRFSDPGVITARHLLTHLSGLPSNINKGHWTEERFSDLIERLRTEYASYPVDFITNYSNIGYSLLGSIIEENTDYLFEEYIQKHFFDPLQMTQSNFNPYGPTGQNAAIGYQEHRPQPNLPLRDIPAMGLNTSLTDLSRFIQMLLNKGNYHGQQIMEADIVTEMFTPQNKSVPLDFDNMIGIPWRLNRMGKQQVLIAEQGGTTINFSSQIALAPEKELGIIILSNTRQVNPLIANIARKLLNHLIDNQHNIMVEKVENSTARTKHPQKPNAKARYIARTGIIEIDRNTGKFCECQTKRTLNLVPLPDGWFGLSPDNNRFSSKITEQEVDGKKVIVIEQNGKKHRIAASLRATGNRFNWKQHYGNYEIINPDKDFPVTDVRIFEEDDMTYICYRMPKLSNKLVVLPITPVSETEAITEGLGRSKGETVYSQHLDGEDLLIYSGYIARKKKD